MILALVYAVAGVIRLNAPGPLVAVTPPSLPQPESVVALARFAERRGAAARGRMDLALYALCVWPAKFQHMQLELAAPDHRRGPGYHVPRLLTRPRIICGGCGPAARSTFFPAAYERPGTIAGHALLVDLEFVLQV